MNKPCTDAEWKILEVLWESHPRTMPEITKILEPETGWTRHTEITLLKRMAEKGTISVDESGTIKRYSPIVTRQEAVTIFYRYCVDYNLMSVDSGLALDGFADQEHVAAFAADAFTWAVATGLISGSQSGGSYYLNPIDNLNRAQAAVLLQRCVEDIM